MKELKGKKVAIVCDWLTQVGGAERVVLALHQMFPEAPIYTSQYDPDAIDWFKDADVRTTWLQKLPRAFRKFLPVLRAWTFSRLDLTNYDLIISSSGAEAKFIKKLKPGARHICYCHSPTHYYWIRYDEYIKHPGFGVFDPLARLGLKLLAGPMRKWDLRAAKRPDVMVANSNFTKENIRKYYGREAVVVHPPVDVERFKPTGKEKHHGFVTAGRQTPYKRIDLAVLACTKLNLPLTVIGNGPEHTKLVKMAGPTITFDTTVTDKKIADYFRHAEGFIFPGKEDFGIVAVEALAAGTPVIAYKAGGALDYILPGQNGEFFEQQTTESLCSVLEKLNTSNYRSTVQIANEFSATSFSSNLHSFY